MAAQGRKACIVGVGESAYAKRGQSTESEYRLALHAVLNAVADAGLTAADIDGFSAFGDDRTLPTALAADLRVPELRFATMTSIPGGGGGCAAVAEAAMAVETGQADAVVVYRSLCQGRSRIGRLLAEKVVAVPTPSVRDAADDAEALQSFSAPFGVLGPATMFAFTMRRHMAVYGTTSEHLAHVAVTIREHAQKNPRALMAGRPMTIDDHQGSRLIVDPYRLLDCCLETDGACAVVVTTEERARDLAKPVVSILASAQGTATHLGGPLAYGAPAEAAATGGGTDVARRLWARAGVGPGDIDVVQVYDNFTGHVLLSLEDYGFCGRGESGPFVASGALRADGGSLPTNTAGGNLSEVYLQGMNHVVEGVRQLRGESTSQVDGAELCFVNSSPGIATSALVLARS